MEVHLDSEDSTMASGKRTGKPSRPAGRPAPSPTEVANQTGEEAASPAEIEPWH